MAYLRYGAKIRWRLAAHTWQHAEYPRLETGQCCLPAAEARHTGGIPAHMPGLALASAALLRSWLLLYDAYRQIEGERAAWRQLSALGKHIRGLFRWLELLADALDLPPVRFTCVEVVVHAIDLACHGGLGIVRYFTAYLTHGHRYKRSISKRHLLCCHVSPREKPHVGAAIGEQDGHSDEQCSLAPALPAAYGAGDVDHVLVHESLLTIGAGHKKRHCKLFTYSVRNRLTSSSQRLCCWPIFIPADQRAWLGYHADFFLAFDIRDVGSKSCTWPPKILSNTRPLP